MLDIANLSKVFGLHLNTRSESRNSKLLLKLFVSLALVATFLSTASIHVAKGWTTNPTQALVFSGFNGDAEGIGAALVRTDASENLYVSGTSAGTAQYDAANPALRIGTGVDWSNHLIKYSREGDLVWKREWTIAAGDILFSDIEVTSSGDVYLGGYAQSGVDVDPGAATQVVASSGVVGIVVKLNTNGDFQWVKEFSASDSSVQDVAVRSDGSLVTGGMFSGTLNLNSAGGPGGVSLTSGGLTDAFVASLSSSGVEQWAVRGSTSGGDGITSLDVTSAGDVVAVGWTRGTITLGSSTSVTISGSNVGHFVWKVNSSGVTQWAIAPDPTPSTSSYSAQVVVRGNGSVLVGALIGNLFEISSAGVLTSTLATGATIISLIELTTQHVMIGGSYTGTVDLDPTSGANTKTATGGGTDGYFTTLSPTLSYLSSRVWDGVQYEEINSLNSMADGGFIAVGRSFTSASLSLSVPSDGTTYSAAAGADSMRFIVRYNSDGTTVSTTTTTTTIPVPSSPTSVSYTPGNKSVRIRWAANSTATGFEVLSSSGKKLCETTSTSCLVSKLKNGTIYRVSVRAVNASSQVSTATSIRVIPGFTLKTYSYKVKKKPLLSGILTTPSKGRKTWSVSGGCRISGIRLVTPSKKATCKLTLSVTRTSKYPAMKTKISVTVTK